MNIPTSTLYNDRDLQNTNQQIQLPQNLQVVAKRYSLLLQEQQKLKEYNNTCQKNLYKTFYKVSQKIWHTIIPKFIYKNITQYNHILQSLRKHTKRNYTSITNLQDKSNKYMKMFERKSLQQILNQRKFAISLIYKQTDIQKIHDLCNTQKFTKIKELFGVRINPIEIECDRNKQWTIKMHQLQQEVQINEIIGKKSHQLALSILQVDNIIQRQSNGHRKCINNFRMKNRQEDKQNNQKSAYQDNSQIQLKIPQKYQYQQKSNKFGKDISNYIQSNLDVSKYYQLQDHYGNQSQKQKLQFPIIVLLWRGLFDQLILLQWQSLQNQDWSQNNKLMNALRSQYIKQEKIKLYLQQQSQKKMNQVIVQTQKTLLSTSQK